MQQGNSLRTTLKLTCISRLRSALSTSSCCWSSPRGHIRWASFIGWSQTTMKWCVVRLHRTRPWRPSYQESTVCHRAIMVVPLLPVRPSTTGRTVISTVHCVSSCNHGCPSPPCQAINYWKNAQLCQQFYYRPCTYSVQQGCENYQVITKVLEQTFK